MKKETKENHGGEGSYDDTEIKSQIKDLEEEDKRLRKDLEAIGQEKEVEGERITLPDSLETRFRSFAIGGNSKQETREGYNLFNANNITFSNRNNTGNPIVISDNKINITIMGVWARISCLVNGLKANTSYRISCSWKTDITISAGLWNGSNFSSEAIKKSNSSDVYLESTSNENGELSFYFYCNYSGEAITNKIVEFDKIMIVEGIEKKEYEAYGVSPTIEYPSEIKAVKDNINVVISNKNLLEIQNKEDTINGFYMQANNNYLSIVSGNATNSWYSLSSNQGWLKLPKLEIGKEYIVTIKSTFKENHNINLWFDNNEQNRILQTVTVNAMAEGNSESSFIYNPEAGYEVDRFRIAISNFIVGQEYIGTFFIQVEEAGSKTNYIEHQEQTYFLPVQQEMLEGDSYKRVNGEWKEHHVWTKIESYNGEEITTEYKSTTGELTQNATVYYKNEFDLVCTEEQSKVLNEIEKTAHTYKGATHVYSTNEISPIFKVKYTKEVTIVTLEERMKGIEENIGEISTVLDTINGEVV